MDKEDPLKRKRVNHARKKVSRAPNFHLDDIRGERKPTKKPHQKLHRCKKCHACNQKDCGDCVNCRDMPKFGGTGRLKQACIHRKCEAPIPPDSQSAITDFFRPPKAKDPKRPEELPADVIPRQPPPKSLPKRRPKGWFEEESSVVIDLSEPETSFTIEPPKSPPVKRRCLSPPQEDIFSTPISARTRDRPVTDRGPRAREELDVIIIEDEAAVNQIPQSCPQPRRRSSSSLHRDGHRRGEDSEFNTHHSSPHLASFSHHQRDDRVTGHPWSDQRVVSRSAPHNEVDTASSHNQNHSEFNPHHSSPHLASFSHHQRDDRVTGHPWSDQRVVSRSAPHNEVDTASYPQLPDTRVSGNPSHSPISSDDRVFAHSTPNFKDSKRDSHPQTNFEEDHWGDSDSTNEWRSDGGLSFREWHRRRAQRRASYSPDDRFTGNPSDCRTGSDSRTFTKPNLRESNFRDREADFEGLCASERSNDHSRAQDNNNNSEVSWERQRMVSEGNLSEGTGGAPIDPGVFATPPPPRTRTIKGFNPTGSMLSRRSDKGESHEFTTPLSSRSSKEPVTLPKIVLAKPLSSHSHTKIPNRQLNSTNGQNKNEKKKAPRVRKKLRIKTVTQKKKSSKETTKKKDSHSSSSSSSRGSTPRKSKKKSSSAADLPSSPPNTEVFFSHVTILFEVCESTTFMCICYGSDSPPPASPQASPRGSPGGSPRYYRGGNRRQQYAIAKAQMKKQGGENFGPPPKGKQMNDMPFFPELRGASYSLELKKWTFPLYLHDHIAEVLEKIKEPHITVKPIPRPVLSSLLPSVFPSQSNKRGRKKSKSDSPAPIDKPPAPREEALDLSRLPPHFLPDLLPFQLEGIAYGLKRNARMLLGDEMGLGKTVQGIALASCYPESWPLLIICPSSVRMSWRDELVKWVPSIGCPDNVNVILSSKDSIPSCYKVHIISYDLVEKMKDSLHDLSPQFVIADESHYIKSMEAKRTKAVLPLLKKAKHTLLLSGTPSLSRPSELYPQLQALGAEIFPTFKEYAFRYCNAFSTPYGLDHSGSSHLKELSTILRHTVMLRRLKGDVLKELPSKRRHRVVLSVPQEVSEAMKVGFGKLRAADNNRALPAANLGDPLQHSNQRRKIMMQLYQDSAFGKIDSVNEYLRDFIPKQSEKGKKVILFAHHQDVMDELESTIASMGKQFIRIDGKTSSKERKPLCDRFQTNPNVEVALLSITAAGVGITLTAASTVIFVELYWTPGACLQAEDRAHRIGQSENVEIIYLIGKGTLDETLWKMLMRKVTVVGNTLGGGADDSSMEFTAQTLKTLIAALGQQGEGEGEEEEEEDPIVSETGPKRGERRIESYCQVIPTEVTERIPETDDEDFVDGMGEEVIMGEDRGEQSDEKEFCGPRKRRFKQRKVLFDEKDGEDLDNSEDEQSEYSEDEEDQRFIDNREIEEIEEMEEIEEVEEIEGIEDSDFEDDDIGLVESPSKSFGRISETDEECTPITNRMTRSACQRGLSDRGYGVEILEKGSPNEGINEGASPTVGRNDVVLVEGDNSPPRSRFSQVSMTPETQDFSFHSTQSPSCEGSPVLSSQFSVSPMLSPSSPVELLSMNLATPSSGRERREDKGKEKEEKRVKSPFFSKGTQPACEFLKQVAWKKTTQTKPPISGGRTPDPITDFSGEEEKKRSRGRGGEEEEEGGFLIHDASMEYSQDEYGIYGSSLTTPGSNIR